jgi:hypothetical protein
MLGLEVLLRTAYSLTGAHHPGDRRAAADERTMPERVARNFIKVTIR